MYQRSGGASEGCCSLGRRRNGDFSLDRMWSYSSSEAYNTDHNLVPLVPLLALPTSVTMDCLHLQLDSVQWSSVSLPLSPHSSSQGHDWSSRVFEADGSCQVASRWVSVSRVSFLQWQNSVARRLMLFTLGVDLSSESWHPLYCHLSLVVFTRNNDSCKLWWMIHKSVML